MKKSKLILPIICSGVILNVTVSSAYAVNNIPQLMEKKNSEDSFDKTIWVKGIVAPQKNDFKTKEEDGRVYFSAADKKGTNWYDINKKVNGPDINLCSAAVAANMLHWWLIQNKDYVTRYINLDEQNGKAYFKNELVGDIRNFVDSYENQDKSKIFEKFTEYFGGRRSGVWTDTVTDMFINGYVPSTYGYSNTESRYNPEKSDSRGGYFRNVFGKTILTERYDINRYSNDFSTKLKSLLDEGRAVGVSFKYSMTNGVGHIVSVWGAEFDENGKATALYITDSDDQIRYIDKDYKEKMALVRYTVNYDDGMPRVTTLKENRYGGIVLSLYSLKLGTEQWENYFNKEDIKKKEKELKAKEAEERKKRVAEAEKITIVKDEAKKYEVVENKKISETIKPRSRRAISTEEQNHNSQQAQLAINNLKKHSEELESLIADIENNKKEVTQDLQTKLINLNEKIDEDLNKVKELLKKVTDNEENTRLTNQIKNVNSYGEAYLKALKPKTTTNEEVVEKVRNNETEETKKEVEKIKVANEKISKAEEKVAELTKKLETQKQDVNYQKNLGAFSWFSSLGNSGQSALDFLNKYTLETKGNSKSATSVENIKRALELMKEVNAEREKVGKAPLGTNYLNLASAMVRADELKKEYSSKEINKIPGDVELIDKGHENPLEIWIEAQREEYNKHKDNKLVDDYANIISNDYSIMALGINQLGTGTGNKSIFSTLNMALNNNSLNTDKKEISEMESIFNDWLKKVEAKEQEIAKIQKELEQAKKEVEKLSLDNNKIDVLNKLDITGNQMAVLPIKAGDREIYIKVNPKITLGANLYREAGKVVLVYKDGTNIPDEKGIIVLKLEDTENNTIKAGDSIKVTLLNKSVSVVSTVIVNVPATDDAVSTEPIFDENTIAKEKDKLKSEKEKENVVPKIEGTSEEDTPKAMDEPKMEEAPKVDTPKAMDEPKMEEMPKVDVPKTMDEPKMEEAPKVDTPKTMDEPKMEEAPKVDTPKTMDEPKMEEAPKVDTPKTMDEPKMEEAPKVDVPKTMDEPKMEEMPKVDTPKTMDEPKMEEAPKVDTPKTMDEPKMEEMPKVDTPKAMDEPKMEEAPKVDAPKTMDEPKMEEMPKVDTPKTMDEPKMEEAPKVDTPKAMDEPKMEEAPKVDTPKTMDEPKMEEMPKVDTPKTMDEPKMEEAPKVDAPKTMDEPKNEEKDMVAEKDLIVEPEYYDINGDDDKDGYTNIEELKTGTNPNDANSKPKMEEEPKVDTPKTMDEPKMEEAPKVDTPKTMDEPKMTQIPIIKENKKLLPKTGLTNNLTNYFTALSLILVAFFVKLLNRKTK